MASYPKSRFRCLRTMAKQENPTRDPDPKLKIDSLPSSLPSLPCPQGPEKRTGAEKSGHCPLALSVKNGKTKLVVPEKEQEKDAKTGGKGRKSMTGNTFRGVK